MIHLDFETYSELDVRNVGSFRYASHPSTDILIMAWYEERADAPYEVQAWSPYHELQPPDYVMEAIERGEEIGAHNAQFEYAIWNTVGVKRYGWRPLKREQMICTAAQAATASLPRSLDGACSALRLSQQKDPDGKRLIKIFSMPGKHGRVLPADAPEEFQRFIDYCKQDVRSESALNWSLPPISPREREIFAFDLKMNERGVQIDIPLVRKTLKVVNYLEAESRDRVLKMTNGIKPTQRDKFMAHLNLEGLEVENLQKTNLERIMKGDLSPEIRELLELRLESSKASTKKLITMINTADTDGRVKGTVLYHGAHTGRWTGRLVQPHNFIRGLMKEREREAVFRLLELCDPVAIQLLFDKPMDAISQVMRGFIIPGPGSRLLVVDYKQIELRILMWLAQEIAALKRLRAGYDLYKWMAGKLFDKTYEFELGIEDIEDDERRNGKNLVLGCGFQLGAKKFVEYSDKAGTIITEEFAKYAVGIYRSEHPCVKDYWKAVQNAALAAVQERGVTRIRQIIFDGRDVTFFRIQLPSGRWLYYPYPEVHMVKSLYQRNGKDWMEPQLTYMEEDNGRFYRNSTYGGKLVENIVQGTARDVMAEGMLSAEAAGYPIIMNVHDEIIAEREIGQGSLHELADLACRLPDWIGDCPIEAEGFEALRYKKG